MADLLKCSEYTKIRVRMNPMDSQVDELIGMAKNRIDNEIHIKQLQKERWNYATFTMANGKLRFIITDQEKLDANLIEEMRVQESLTKLDATFVALDTLFAEVTEKLDGFVTPCLSELKIYQQNLKNDAFTTSEKMRHELSYRMESIRNKGIHVDEVLKSADWMIYKNGAENRIKLIDEKIEICNTYIQQISEIIK